MYICSITKIDCLVQKVLVCFLMWYHTITDQAVCKAHVSDRPEIDNSTIENFIGNWQFQKYLCILHRLQTLIIGLLHKAPVYYDWSCV